MEKLRKQYPSGAQKARLVGLLEADPQLRSGKFSAAFTKKIAESRWRSIATELNAMGGAAKEWTEWRKCWQDIKSKTKKKASIIRRAHHATGGGPSIAPLNTVEEMVLSTISDASISGHADSSESAVAFKDLNMTNRAFASPGIFDVEVIQEDYEDNNTSEELNYQSEKEGTENKKEEKKTKRVSRAEKAAEDLNETFKLKLAVKQQFYDNYIAEMRRQTDALLKIAENLKK